MPNARLLGITIKNKNKNNHYIINDYINIYLRIYTWAKNFKQKTSLSVETLKKYNG